MFNVGDVVRLKGSKQNMTVAGVVGERGWKPTGSIKCLWFDSIDEIHEEYFHPDALKKIKEEKYGA